MGVGVQVETGDKCVGASLTSDGFAGWKGPGGVGPGAFGGDAGCGV